MTWCRSVPSSPATSRAQRMRPPTSTTCCTRRTTASSPSTMRSSRACWVATASPRCIDESWEEKDEHYEGLSAEEVSALQQDADIEITSVELMGMVHPEGMVEGASPEQFSVVAKRRENLRRFVVE